MRSFVKVLAVIVLVVSGLALLAGTLEFIIGSSQEKDQAVLILAIALGGGLLGGVSWVLMDVANTLARTAKEQ